MTNQQTTKATRTCGIDTSIQSMHCLHVSMLFYFQISNGLWFPPYQTLSTWSAETVRIFLNYVCTFFKKHPGKSSVFICLTSIALSWITSSLLKFQFISWKMYDCFSLFQFTFCDLIRHDFNYRIVFKISIYDQIGPTLNPDPGTTKFTISVESFMDIITIHFGFLKYIYKRREDLLRPRGHVLNNLDRALNGRQYYVFSFPHMCWTIFENFYFFFLDISPIQ